MIKNGLKCSKTTILAETGAQVRRGEGSAGLPLQISAWGGPKGGGQGSDGGGLARDSRQS